MFLSIDKDNVKKLIVDQAWSLDRDKVVVGINNLGRPIVDKGGLFSTVMGYLASTKYGISYKA